MPGHEAAEAISQPPRRTFLHCCTCCPPLPSPVRFILLSPLMLFCSNLGDAHARHIVCLGNHPHLGLWHSRYSSHKEADMRHVC